MRVLEHAEKIGNVRMTCCQQEIQGFVHLSVRRIGYPLTRADICNHFGFRSPNAAVQHLQALERKAVIRVDGVQYASHAFRRLLKTHGMLGSMSRKGDCWDNAVVESFFGTLKSEHVSWQDYQTRHQARNDVVDYIAMFYNPLRLHSYLDYKSPDQYEWTAQWDKVA